jgi:E1A/CREB-binding protein
MELHVRVSRGAPTHDIKKRLFPLLKRLMEHQYGWVFSVPVDPVKLKIPDYFDIVKNPMDLGTVRKSLEAGKYRHPDNFARAVLLTFENAILYNPEGSEVNTMARNLAQTFHAEYSKVIARFREEQQRLKMQGNENSCTLCRGVLREFKPPVYYCNSCRQPIARNRYYMVTKENKYHWCTGCVSELRESIVCDDGVTLRKSELIKKKHDEKFEEPWVQCDKCQMWVHQLCALFNGKRNSHTNVSYYCPFCLHKHMQQHNKQYLMPRPPGAVDIPVTNLSAFLENRVRTQMAAWAAKERDESGKPSQGFDTVTIRVVAVTTKLKHTTPKMYERYKDRGYPANHKYRSKCVLMFQTLDHVETLLFGMYVQEYAADNRVNNARGVYISYLDSVNYFRPPKYRTATYHELLIAYMEYVKKCGFLFAFIWACPPLKNDDYILYGHPEEQKTPKGDRLTQWYMDMLRESKARGHVHALSTLWREFFFLEPDETPRFLPGLSGAAGDVNSTSVAWQGASQASVESSRRGHLSAKKANVAAATSAQVRFGIVVVQWHE